MLYHLFTWLHQLHDVPGFGVFRYLSFRAVLAAVFSLVICLVVGRYIILLLKSRLIGEKIRELGPATHKAKSGTPTMGGIFIILAIVVPTLLWADLTNAYILLLLVATLWMGFIGFVDDYIKVFKKNKAGLQGKFKIVGQVGLGLIVGITMVTHPHFRGDKLRVDNSGKIVRVSDELATAGFKVGDRIAEIEGKPFAKFVFQGQEATVNSYLLERGHESVLLKVAEGQESAVFVGLFGKRDVGYATSTNIPFFKSEQFNYGSIAFWEDRTDSIWAQIIYVIMAILIVTAVSNGVNLTDGIDGLAAGTTGIVAAAMGVFAYLAGNAIFSEYLNIRFIPLGGELIIFIAALVGACLGFLWFNAYPAQVFMGDTGSLALGGAVGVLALMIKIELLLPILCGIFFVESLSVIMQVSYFKYTKKKYGEGRRIFKMSPLHHHYELAGWHESKIVTRFYIIGLLLAILTFATLKLR